MKPCISYKKRVESVEHELDRRLAELKEIPTDLPVSDELINIQTRIIELTKAKKEKLKELLSRCWKGTY